MNAFTHAFVAEEFSAVRKGSLRGFAKVILPSGLVLSDVSIHVDAGKAWASPASKPMLDKNGQVLRDAAGKIRYVSIVGFTSKQVRDRFSDAVIAAVSLAFPEALG
jgi:hypothetical protein